MAPSHSRHAYERPPDQRGPPCAPWQRRVQEIQIIYFDINGTSASARKKRVRQYKDGIRRRIHRAKDIGPLKYYEKPVTPAPNPENPKVRKLADPLNPNSGYIDVPNSGHTYHIIELTDTGRNSGKRVQLLICDYNQYLVAFRRQSAGEWSTWYNIGDWPLPEHFQAIELEIDGDHSFHSTMGGNQCFEDMFYGMANYPEHGDIDRLERAFLRAVILFCEGIRLRIVYDEMVKRLGLIMDAVPLTEYMWAQINGWGNLSELALECGKNRGFVDLKRQDGLIRGGKMTTFYMLIAHEKSDLMLLMRSERVLQHKPKKVTSKIAIRVADPGFPAPEAGLA